MSFDLIPNWTLIIQLVIVLSLMGILTRMVFKPFINVLQERKNRIEGTEQKAKDLQQQANELIERYREAITAAQAQGASIRDEIRKTSMMEEMAILEKAMGEANRLIQEVKGRITEESRTARVDLRFLAQNLSREITEKILGRSLR
jgi:F-type H+-transporting ATPase subunit b